MVTLSLEEVIKQTIKNLLDGKVDKRVKSYSDLESKYAVLKPSVKVQIELSKGIVATVDISDFFKEELK